MVDNDFFNFFSLNDKSLDLAEIRNWSKLPFLSTDLTPAFETVNLKLLLSSSLLNLTFFRLGRNLNPQQ